jgi:hypothetical protein
MLRGVVLPSAQVTPPRLHLQWTCRLQAAATMQQPPPLARGPSLRLGRLRRLMLRLHPLPQVRLQLPVAPFQLQ